MGLVSPQQSSEGQTIEASDVNNPVNTIANEFNGSIEAANLATDAITTVKITDGAVESEKLGSTIAFSAYKNAQQTISNTTITVVTGFTERFDSGSDFDATTGIFTCPVAGKYSFNTGATVSNLAASDVQYTYIYHNGAIAQRTTNYASATGLENTGTPNVILDCAASDTVDLRVYHNYGSDRELLDGSWTWFTGYYIGA